MARAKKSRISVLNWMGTLLLCAIPGVNLIALICFWIFAKSPSKKSFAQAALLWMVIAVVLMVVAPEAADPTVALTPSPTAVPTVAPTAALAATPSA